MQENKWTLGQSKYGNDVMGSLLFSYLDINRIWMDQENIPNWI
jgi:hypothetical protein